MNNVDIKFNNEADLFHKTAALWVHISESDDVRLNEHASLKWTMVHLGERKFPTDEDASKAVHQALKANGVELTEGLNLYVADREMMNPLSFKELEKVVVVKYTAR